MISLLAKDKEFLLKFAKDSIGHYLNFKKLLAIDNVPDKFSQPTAVFVTLTVNNDLRGCIGNLKAEDPLYLTVQKNAINAAFHDPRFLPLTKEEFEKIKIEISVLSEAELSSVEKIKKYIDGVIIEKDGKQATFLPQVWQQISDKKNFLQELCVKAGMSPNDYLDSNIKIYTYQVISFSD